MDFFKEHRKLTGEWSDRVTGRYFSRLDPARKYMECLCLPYRERQWGGRVHVPEVQTLVIDTARIIRAIERAVNQVLTALINHQVCNPGANEAQRPWDREEIPLTPDEAAQFLGIPVASIHKLCRAGAIPYEVTNSRGDRLFRLENLRTYRESRVVPSRSIAKEGKPKEPLNRRPTSSSRDKSAKQNSSREMGKEMRELWRK